MKVSYSSTNLINKSGILQFKAQMEKAQRIIHLVTCKLPDSANKILHEIVSRCGCTRGLTQKLKQFPQVSETLVHSLGPGHPEHYTGAL